MAPLSRGPGCSDWANDSTLKYRQQTVCTLLSTGLINMHFYGIVFVKERSERKSLKYICLFSALYWLCTRDPVTAPVPSLTRWSRSQHTPPIPGRSLVGWLQCWSLIGQIINVHISDNRDALASMSSNKTEKMSDIRKHIHVTKAWHPTLAHNKFLYSLDKSRMN